MNTETLGAYLEHRLQNLAEKLSASWLCLRSNGDKLAEVGKPATGATVGSLPLVYGEETIGELAFAGAARDTVLEAAAGELAALLKARDQRLAIALDCLMEKLALDEPVCTWAGIYLLHGDVLYLTAYRGAPTPHPIIPRSKGICGAAVEENRTLNIEDVTKDPRYLSCDIRAKSELVVPIRDGQGTPIGEVDIDSHKLNAFHPALVQKVEELAREISTLMLQ